MNPSLGGSAATVLVADGPSAFTCQMGWLIILPCGATDHGIWQHKSPATLPALELFRLTMYQRLLEM